ncbi:MAG TPA: hypothetical protein VFA60_01400 [Terriglobales bacterium]|nr:hypothetical protein [Terriglobales bacterium]
MLNALVAISLALFGVSAGAVIGTRIRAGRRVPALPALADIALLGALLGAAYYVRLRVLGPNFFAWLAICLGCGALVQWLKRLPRGLHGLTQ